MFFPLNSFYFWLTLPLCSKLCYMESIMNTQVKGLTIVGLMLAAAAVILAFFFVDMAENALMGASTRYKPEILVAAPTDITKAPQCAPGYDKTWVGCQSLAQ